MATIPASENEFPEVLFAEGAAPSTPAAGLVKQYAKSDGLLYSKDDAGVESALGVGGHLADASDAHDASAISILDSGAHFTATDVEAALAELFSAISGGGIAATLADNAGDMLVASANDTWAKLATPTVNGQALQRVSGSPAWALPPGYEFDYAQWTSNVQPTATTEATANTVVTGNAVTYDGSTAVIIEFFCPDARPDAAAASRSMQLWLYDGSSSIGQIGALSTPAAASDVKPIVCRVRITPSAAAHTYSIRASVSAGTGRLNAGAGGNGVIYPGYIRIVKA